MRHVRPVERQDEKFVEKASSGNLQESKLGEVGQLKGQSTQVKEYAKRMVLDHGNAGSLPTGVCDRRRLSSPRGLIEKLMSGPLSGAVEIENGCSRSE